ncbi:MAG TPA: malto-oligosyltrehalose synthase, partial [Thermoanaerobaculia bacterium]
DLDRRSVDEAIAGAKARRSDLPADLFDFFRDLLLLEIRGPGGSQAESELVMRFQQLTGPAMAKGVEDTAFYNFHRLIALNEVGGSPGDFGLSVEAFHSLSVEAQRLWPRALLATSTHDTKRSEDVRARISLLSEMPEEWGTAVRRWIDHNARHRRGDFPDRNAEYLLYQTLVGAWPISAGRAAAYMEKAAREAKAFTSWTRQNPEYEEALRAFVTSVLEDRDFVADLEAFVAPLVAPGRINSLAQTLLKTAAPGVPDFYQGSEVWDLSLVDPDNRRPVDYELRRSLLSDLKRGMTPEEVLARMDDGLPKLWLIHQGLQLRRRSPEAFGPAGAYEPLRAAGPRAEHVVAFLRGGAVAAVAPRLPMRLQGDWQGTTLELPPGSWRDELTGEESEGGLRAVSDLLARFPVALLARST